MRATFEKKALKDREIVHNYNSGVPIEQVPEWTYLDWIPIDGKWHHIVITHTPKCEKKYVDGELVHETVFNS